MLSFIGGFILGIIGYYAALISVGRSVVSSSSFEEFIKSIQQKVYALILVVLGFWVFLDATLLISLALTYMLTLCIVDYEHTYDNFMEE
jgi:hypothetical protein